MKEDYFKIYDIFLNRQVPSRLMQTLSPKLYVFEYACLHINLGRGTGKTTFIKDTATVNDLVIVPTSHGYKSGFNEGVVVYDASRHNKSRVLAGLNFKNVFVDNPSNISNLDSILDCISWNHQQNLVLVGS